MQDLKICCRLCRKVTAQLNFKLGCCSKIFSSSPKQYKFLAALLFVKKVAVIRQKFDIRGSLVEFAAKEFLFAALCLQLRKQNSQLVYRYKRPCLRLLLSIISYLLQFNYKLSCKFFKLNWCIFITCPSFAVFTSYIYIYIAIARSSAI